MKIDILVMVKKSVMSIFTLQSGDILAATSNSTAPSFVFVCAACYLSACVNMGKS